MTDFESVREPPHSAPTDGADIKLQPPKNEPGRVFGVLSQQNERNELSQREERDARHRRLTEYARAVEVQRQIAGWSDLRREERREIAEAVCAEWKRWAEE